MNTHKYFCTYVAKKKKHYQDKSMLAKGTVISTKACEKRALSKTGRIHYDD